LHFFLRSFFPSFRISFFPSCWCFAFPSATTFCRICAVCLSGWIIDCNGKTKEDEPGCWDKPTISFEMEFGGTPVLGE
jgi:hypothetical protein